MAVFAVLFATLAAWELLRPRRALRDSKPRRWLSNLGVFVLDVAVVRVVFPLAAVGFNLPWWDRMFATYRAQPRDGHTGMHIGLRDIPERQSLLGIVLLPFRSRGQQPVHPAR